MLSYTQGTPNIPTLVCTSFVGMEGGLVDHSDHTQLFSTPKNPKHGDLHLLVTCTKSCHSGFTFHVASLRICPRASSGDGVDFGFEFSSYPLQLRRGNSGCLVFFWRGVGGNPKLPPSPQGRRVWVCGWVLGGGGRWAEIHTAPPCLVTKRPELHTQHHVGQGCRWVDTTHVHGSRTNESSPALQH